MSDHPIETIPYKGCTIKVYQDEDSRKAEKQFRVCNRFAKRLQRFFSEQEIEALQEIR